MDPSSLLDLSQNLNPFAPNAAAIAGHHLNSLRFYPDTATASRLLAETLGVDSGRLALTNGGSEAISLVTAAVGGRVWSEPEFGLYPRRNENPETMRPSLSTGKRADHSEPVWRSDPHSPSGRLAAPDEAADIWDEAFYPLATASWTGARPGITVGSLTKVFACPGLRLGYMIADDAQEFTRRQPEWPVGSLGLAMLPDLLENADLARWSSEIASHRQELAELFTDRGFDVQTADAPWVLVNALNLRERLAPHGVVVRDCSSFGMPGTTRVAVPDAEGLERLAVALNHTPAPL